MGVIYETVVTCIGYVLVFGAIIMLMFGYFAENGGLDNWDMPKPQAPEIIDAEYSIVENEDPSYHTISSAKHFLKYGNS